MKMIRQILNRINIAQIVKKHPIEIVITCVLTLFYLFLNPAYFNKYSDENMLGLFQAFPLLFMMSYILSAYRKWYGLSVIYAILGISVVMYVGLDSRLYTHSPIYWGLLYIHFILFIGQGFYKDNKALVSSSVRILLHLGFALFLSVIVLFMVLFLEYAIELLFGITDFSDNKAIIIVYSFCMPIFFLYFEQQKEQFINNQAILRLGSIVVNFIISPFVILYTVVIYAYILGILINFSLPNGKTANIILPYLCIGALCIALNLVLNVSKWQRFYRYFHWLSILPLGLLWFAIAQRVTHYGLTESRIYLIAYSLGISIYILYCFIPKLFFYRIFYAIAIGIIFLTTMVISPKDIAMNSQYARFMRIATELELIDHHNQIKPEVLLKDYSIKFEHSKRYKELVGIINAYITKQPQWVNLYGKAHLDKLSDLNVQQDLEYFSISIDNTRYAFIDLNKYRRFLPLDRYFSFYESPDEEGFDFTKTFLILSDTVNDKEKKIEIDGHHILQFFRKRGIDLTQKLRNIEVIKKDSLDLLYLPTLDGGLVILDDLSFRFKEDDDVKGYKLRSFKVIGYFEPNN